MGLINHQISTKNWKLKAEKLKDIAKCKMRRMQLEKLLSENLKSLNPLIKKGQFKHIGKKLKVIDRFFEKYQNPVDICIILYGGLDEADYKLANHLEENNLLFYRPLASYIWDINERESFLEGTIHPERTLLLFDDEMYKGKTMSETADLFQGLGYDRNKIFAYLNRGILHSSLGGPKLAHVDKLLEKAESLNGRRKENEI